jgi:hypothetical protein
VDVSYYYSEEGEIVFWVDGVGRKIKLPWRRMRRILEGEQGEEGEDWERRRWQL